MDEHKTRFIEFLLKTGALRVGKDYSLKSKRLSPWFVNVGDFNDGETSEALGGFYADAILSTGIDFNILYGIPEKGKGIAVATAIALNRKGKNKPWFSTRKTPKEYGEATNLSPAERIKALVVGRAPQNGQAICQLDDVMTAGDAKYEARETLQSMGDFKLPMLAIAVDRQEVGITGENAIEKYELDTKTRVVPIVNAFDVYTFLLETTAAAPVQTPNGEIRREDVERIKNYLRVYGTKQAKRALDINPLEQKVIDAEKSVIVACDVDLARFEQIVKETADNPKIGAYKIPARAGRKGWERWVETAKRHTQKPLIYDHQKAGNDIPDTGKDLMKDVKEAGFDAVILFPHSGPETERAWIYHALEAGLKVIVGGWMTHPAYAQSEGGFILDEGILEMYRIAARAGIQDLVVPGNKPEVIERVKQTVEECGVNPIFYPPGLIKQGGKIEDVAKVAGKRWHTIIGTAIYTAEDIRKTAAELTSKI